MCLHLVQTLRISTYNSNIWGTVYTIPLGAGPFWARLADPIGHNSHNSQSGPQRCRMVTIGEKFRVRFKLRKGAWLLYETFDLLKEELDQCKLLRKSSAL